MPTSSRGRRGGARVVRHGPEVRGDAVSLPASDPESVARKILLAKLSAAPRSRAQLSEHLLSRGTPPEVAEPLLDRFTEVGLIDDRAYAEMVVRSKRESAGLSRRGLRHELSKRGVPDDIAEDVLDELDDEQELASAIDLVIRRGERMRDLQPHVRTRRLLSLLGRKGYDAATAYRAIREADEAAGGWEGSEAPE